MLMKKNRILHDTPAPGEGTAPLLGGDSGTPPATPPAGDPPATPPPATGWLSSLPEELRDDATFKKFNDVTALAQSYKNLQKIVGAEKIPVPGKHATDEDWMGVYKKLGLPEDMSKYEVKFKEGVDADISKGFLEQAYKSGVLPKQAQKIADWFAETEAARQAKIEAATKSQVQEEIGKLNQEWGQAFKQNIAIAKQVVGKYAEGDLANQLIAKYGNDTTFIKFIHSIGKDIFTEDQLVDIPGGGGMSPSDAQSEINKIMADKDGPYFNSAHPGHKAAVAEVQKLFQMVTTKK